MQYRKLDELPEHLANEPALFEAEAWTRLACAYVTALPYDTVYTTGVPSDAADFADKMMGEFRKRFFKAAS